MDFNKNISDFDYHLPSERIAKFPLDSREQSKLLVFRDHQILDSRFYNIAQHLPQDSLLVFNDTKVIRARLIFAKSSGARIEVFCLEPHLPADYESAFSVVGSCEWSCIVGNSKKWKQGTITIQYGDHTLSANRGSCADLIHLSWDSGHTFGELLELLGRIPIPPYLERESQEIDNTRYQTMYSTELGSVAAPTAGLHFSQSILDSIPNKASLTLHVGAGTFLPVKCDNVAEHHMHTEHFSVHVDQLAKLASAEGKIVAIGTTTVRTLESLAALGERCLATGDPQVERVVGQFELYGDKQWSNPLSVLHQYMVDNGVTTLHCSTQIMIMPGHRFRTICALVTNFHQPRSTLLLLISAIVGQQWRTIYDHALEHDYRFLSYGDSSILFLQSE